jgi:hypothetical protein
MIKEISKKLKLKLDTLEREIMWIGGMNSKGVSNPKLPFDLSTRNGARFLAAIINDGCLTRDDEDGYGRLMYDNFDESLRNSVIADYTSIFGGKSNEIAFRNYKRKKFLEFPSVVRDIVYIIIKVKGPKSETNPVIPSLIFDNQENLFGWIEQTIADEGEVKYEPVKYRRAIIWRRSLDVTSLFKNSIGKEVPFKKLPLKIQKILYKQKCNLIEDEKKFLDKLGINYNEYNLGVYPTTKGKMRTRWQISITKRENLIKLRKLIKIPSKEKNIKFCKMCEEFVRYKEPLRIKNAIIYLGKHKKTFTSNDLRIKMRYKLITTTYKWLKIFEREGLIKKVKKSEYGNGHYRTMAEYKLLKYI